ncbi:MAG TPA: dephospho-CoA kinase [Acidimicrobiia bacterium]|nr:dephospho-CoA kinase [Acidimicrobiia bacterium]
MSSPDGRWLITGGIGSGKSEVRRLLATRGVRTVDADAVGHAVLANEALAPVAGRWPGVVFEGEIDRKALARIVFANPDELRALEEITHPLIFGRIEAELEGFDGVAAVEMPLVDPGLGWPRIVVDARDEIRVRRAMKRGMSEAEVRERMAAQPSRARWLAGAALVVPNHGDLESLEATVGQLVGYLVEAE